VNSEMSNLVASFMTDLPRQLANLRSGLLSQRRKLAERVGFEPTVPCGTPDFESGTIDHSVTSPEGRAEIAKSLPQMKAEKRPPSGPVCRARF
jgi:hypothetical protein